MSDISELTSEMESGWNELSLKEGAAFLKQSYAYLEIRVDDPRFILHEEPIIIEPAPTEDDPKSKEFVYPIYDYGDRLIASKQSEKEYAVLSMLKMYYTIEKMISILYEKFRESGRQNGTPTDGEVFLYFDGHISCMRKAFEVIINLPENWVVMNFDPGDWGNFYLATLQRLRDKNFDYPPPAPRYNFRYHNAERQSKLKIR